MDKTINNARNPGESFPDYRKRLAEGNKKIKQYLRGQLFYNSSYIVTQKGPKITRVPYKKGREFLEGNG